MLKPSERRSARNRQAILDAAVEIITEEGVAALSMRALADRIDYSTGALYEYFAGKDDILAAACTQGHVRLLAYMSAPDTSMPVDAYLVEIGLAYIRFATENPDYFLLMFTMPPPEMAPGPEDVEMPLAPPQSAYAILQGAIARGIADGTFPASPGFGVLEMSYASWGIVHGIAMLRVTYLRRYPGELEAVDRLALQAFVRGLSCA